MKRVTICVSVWNLRVRCQAIPVILSHLVEKILWSRRWFSQGEVCLLIAEVCGPLRFPQMWETILHNLWYWGTALTLSPGHMCEYQISVKFSFSKTPCFGCFSGGIVFGCVLVFLVLCCQFLSYKYWLVYESWTSCFWLLLINKIALVGLVVLSLVVCCRAWIDVLQRVKCTEDLTDLV